MIEVTSLCKNYRERAALSNLTFRVGEGEVLGFLGPNGAGKTTTMRILAGFIPATSGSAKVAGYDIFEAPLEAKRRIGYLPEQPPVHKEMTVADYLCYCARLKGLPGKHIRAEAEQAAERTRVSDVYRRVIGTLSKGFRQRVGLAQALLGAPPVLILDEPTVGLDPFQILEVRNLITDLAKTGKHTIVLSTHILTEVAELCGKVLIINGGARVAFDTLAALRAHHVDGREASLEEIYLKLIDPTATAHGEESL